MTLIRYYWKLLRLCLIGAHALSTKTMFGCTAASRATLKVWSSACSSAPAPSSQSCARWTRINSSSINEWNAASIYFQCSIFRANSAHHAAQSQATARTTPSRLAQAASLENPVSRCSHQFHTCRFATIEPKQLQCNFNLKKKRKF